jgi:hypothetical protein
MDDEENDQMQMNDADTQGKQTLKATLAKNQIINPKKNIRSLCSLDTLAKRDKIKSLKRSEPKRRTAMQ